MDSVLLPIVGRLRSFAVESLAFWGEFGLAQAVTVEHSWRMTRSIARTYPERHLIRVSASACLIPAADARLVMWHEAAHLVVFNRYGAGVRPHGQEWESLLQTAGLEARLRHAFPARLMPACRPKTPLINRRLAHRCPACGAIAYARIRMSRWRCAACLKQGFAGELVID